MSLYTIADLHLSFGVDKPMNIFNGWENFEQKLENNWKATVNDDDTVVIPGDISWGIKLEECLPDFKFIDSLPGEKIILKGNHDLWFSTKTSAETYFAKNGLHTLKILHNNAYKYKDYVICGTRGWVNCDADVKNLSHDAKIVRRETQRLEMSLAAGQKLGGIPLVFLHYPPIFERNISTEIVNTLHKYGVSEVYYGHLHGKKCKNNTDEELNGIVYHRVSCDYINFKPLKVK